MLIKYSADQWPPQINKIILYVDLRVRHIYIFLIQMLITITKTLNYINNY